MKYKLFIIGIITLILAVSVIGQPSCSLCSVAKILEDISLELQEIKEVMRDNTCKPETHNIQLENPDWGENTETAFLFPPQNIHYKEVNMEELMATVYCDVPEGQESHTCTYEINNNPCYSLTVKKSSTIHDADMSACIPFYIEGTNTQRSIGEINNIFVKVKIAQANC
jgi:hypothetical protein